MSMGAKGEARTVDLHEQIVRALVARRVTELQYDYARALDDDRLEDWPEFFVEDGVYKIVPKENYDRSYPVTLLNCLCKAHLRDRVRILRKAAIFTLRFYRHVIGPVEINRVEDNAYHLRSSFSVYITDIIDGTTTLFGVGQYFDTVVFVEDQPKFKEKLVVLDTFSVANNISTPF